ncbi:unnamed protein product [Brachionus calyciflorus]|uniref:Uncharacterized protein n=1 Tax=Brachionus calyciflorus TaxID=104777 RepID=A0A813ML91_9BILA|nr:unnamed protein product [Brachionus calyciflorus]
MDSKRLLSSQLDNYSYQYFYSLRDNQSLIRRLNIGQKLEFHTGCVNTISWSDRDPSILLSGSDDQNLIISHAFTAKKKELISTNHKSNIFSAKFLPYSNDENIISCSSGGDIYLNNIYSNKSCLFKCHGDKTCYELRACSDSSFVSCGLDGSIKFIDLRSTSKCDQQHSCQEHTLIKNTNGITAITVNPVIPYHLVCAGLDGTLRLYDTRMLSIGSYNLNQSVFDNVNQSAKGLFAVFNPPLSNKDNNPLDGLGPNAKRITSVQYNRTGTEILASYQSDSIYLLDWRDLTDDKELNESQKESQNENSQNSEKRFRIQNDWSDTGPNSMAFNEMSNDDPRAFLARRLGEWFTNLNNTRGLNRSVLNTQNLVTGVEDTTSMNHEEDTNESIENDKAEAEQQQLETDKKKENFMSLTTSFISSRLRAKQAVRLENNIIKSKSSPKVKMILTGHRNARTIIKECNFWGDEYIVSGSDCGHVFFWHKQTGNIVNIIEADKHVVNCVQENPDFPILATSGIDHNVKIWEPTLWCPINNYSKINQCNLSKSCDKIKYMFG